MFDIFTSDAKQAITLAQDEAIGLGNDFVGTGHLLAGLAGITSSAAGRLLTEHGLTQSLTRAQMVEMQAASGLSPASADAPVAALASIGIDVGAIRRHADEAFGPGAFVYPRPVYDADAKRAIEQSVTEAEALGHENVGTGHVLLGLLTRGDSTGALLLRASGIDEATVRLVARTEAGEHAG